MASDAEDLSAASCSESVDSSALFVESFKGATSNVLNRFLKGIKFEELEKYYPEIHEHDPGMLKDMYSQLMNQLKESIKEDIDGLCADQNVYEKLVKLDNLTKKAKISENVKAWRPSGDPNEDVRDYRYKCKLSHRNALKSLLENCRSQNELLHGEVMANHEEIMRLKEAVLAQDEQNKADLRDFEEVDFNMIQSIVQMEDDS